MITNNNDPIKREWLRLIEREAIQPYFLALQAEVDNQRLKGESIFPAEEDVFNAFRFVDLPEVKVVILGQDPYHGVGDENQPQAHGLSFSVNPGIKIPPSLRNIYKELADDIAEFEIPNHGNLTDWAEQGVLLLNTVLTVKQGEAHSHAKLGWDNFTNAVIAELNEKNKGCVFILWGSHAIKKGQKIDKSKHALLTGPHPSPLSAYRGFFGCKHFSKANEWLSMKNKQEINWSIASV